MRPRFFAGQLLTEDDLGALVDYVVAKNRFHNSRLFGEGVVCGLLVECGPCEGQIVVDPGYALDCCGNDLVLTCHQTLDIAPMIRELAAHKDCGCTDPCEEPAIGKTSGQTEGDKTDDKQPKPCKQYYLYARYAERPDQPVAAYPVGNDCDAASCEPTRVVEGIVFELRCDAKPYVPTLEDVAECCTDQEDGKYYVLDAASALQHLGMVAKLSIDSSSLLRPQYAKLLDEAHELDVQASAQDPVLLARYYATVNGIIAHAARNKIELKGFETEALQKKLAIIPSILAKADRETMQPLDRALVMAIAPTAAGDHVERGSAARLASAPELISEAYMREAKEQIQYIVRKLQAKPDCWPRKLHTECGLSMRIDELGQFRAVTEPGQISRMSESAFQTAQVVRHVYGECECAAINPPCPPCDDPAVLLASIEVDHCKVVRICNSVRQYVYAPSSLRYWEAIHGPSRSHCCGRRRSRDAVAAKAQQAIGRRQALEALAEMSDDSPSLKALITPAYRAVLGQPPEVDVAAAAPRVERKKDKKKDGDK